MVPLNPKAGNLEFKIWALGICALTTHFGRSVVPLNAKKSSNVGVLGILGRMVCADGLRFSE